MWYARIFFQRTNQIKVISLSQSPARHKSNIFEKFPKYFIKATEENHVLKLNSQPVSRWSHGTYHCWPRQWQPGQTDITDNMTGDGADVTANADVIENVLVTDQPHTNYHLELLHKSYRCDDQTDNVAMAVHTTIISSLIFKWKACVN